jgi:excisionase family DNA binding protein
MPKSKYLSTFAIADMLHVDPGSVANWVDQRLLKAHRTPGGHRRIRVEDLIAFLRDHQMPIPAALRTTPVRVVVVDGEAAVTHLIARAIKTAHPEYEVVEAHDGFQAGAAVMSLKPDLVVLDLRMPGIDAFGVCSMIKANENSRHAEVLAMIADPSAETDERIRKCGARACLAKPLDIRALMEHVEALV